MKKQQKQFQSLSQSMHKQPNFDSMDFQEKLEYSIRFGAAKAFIEHKRAGIPLTVYRNNKVVKIKPEDIEIPKEFKYLEEQ